MLTMHYIILYVHIYVSLLLSVRNDCTNELLTFFDVKKIINKTSISNSVPALLSNKGISVERINE